MDLDDLEKRFTNIKKELKKEDENLKELVQEISQKDETKQSYDVLYEIFTDEGRDYHRMNEAYKRYISQYSKEYIEMSEWYYGPELPYEIYCKEFKKVNKNTTYLDTPKDINELYFLFIFFAMYEYTLKEIS